MPYPLFSWLNRWRPEQLRGSLVGIYLADVAGAPMRAVASVRALAGCGLEGDRYALDQGHWRQTDACQVTLVTEADLQRAAQRGGCDLGAGQHRRNLVVRGIPLAACRGRRVRIGEVLFEFHRLRPPCGYLDRVAGAGVGRALGPGAGIGLRVIEAGLLRVGDTVQVLERPAPEARS